MKLRIMCTERFIIVLFPLALLIVFISLSHKRGIAHPLSASLSIIFSSLGSHTSIFLTSFYFSSFLDQQLHPLFNDIFEGLIIESVSFIYRFASLE